MLAKETGAEKVLLETDCANTVSKVKATELDRPSTGHLVEEIKRTSEGFCDVLGQPRSKKIG